MSPLATIRRMRHLHLKHLVRKAIVREGRVRQTKVFLNIYKLTTRDPFTPSFTKKRFPTLMGARVSFNCCFAKSGQHQTGNKLHVPTLLFTRSLLVALDNLTYLLVHKTLCNANFPHMFNPNFRQMYSCMIESWRLVSWLFTSYYELFVPRDRLKSHVRLLTI